MNNTNVNPHYEAYAKAHGKTPEAMLEHDSEIYPGGCMTGFITWISQQHQLFFKAHPEAFLDRHTIHNLKAWTQWLKEAASTTP